MRYVLLLVTSMSLLTGCSLVSRQEIKTSAGICDGLAIPIDQQANAALNFGLALQRNINEVPREVLDEGTDYVVAGTAVIKGFDAGCPTEED